MSNAVRNRIVGAIFVTQTLFRSAVILSFTLTSIIAADLVGSDWAAGLPTTVTLVARAALAYPVGWLLDQLGRRIGLSLGFLVGVIGAVISAYAIIIGSFAGFLFAYKGKWTYRSGVLTNIEWLVFRYGHGKAGQAARLTNVVISLITMILMLGYAGTGVGKFIEEFLSIDKSVAIPLLFAFTGLYVLLGGFFSIISFHNFFLDLKTLRN